MFYSVCLSYAKTTRQRNSRKTKDASDDEGGSNDVAKPPACFVEAMARGAADGNDVAPGSQRYETRPADGKGNHDSQLHGAAVALSGAKFGHGGGFLMICFVAAHFASVCHQ